MEHSIQTVKGRFNSGEPLEYVFSWGHHVKPGKMTKACFSQWFPADFVVDDVAYNCTEQYMMGRKHVCLEMMTYGRRCLPATTRKR